MFICFLRGVFSKDINLFWLNSPGNPMEKEKMKYEQRKIAL